MPNSLPAKCARPSIARLRLLAAQIFQVCWRHRAMLLPCLEDPPSFGQLAQICRRLPLTCLPLAIGMREENLCHPWSLSRTGVQEIGKWKLFDMASREEYHCGKYLRKCQASASRAVNNSV